MSCMVLILLEVLVLHRIKQFYTPVNRRIIKACNYFNKFIGAFATLAIFEKFSSYNISGKLIPSLQNNFTAANLAGMLVFIVISFSCWIPWYSIHRKTNPGLWSFGSYLLHKFRYTFFILGIWIPGIFLSEYLSRENSIISADELEICSLALFLIIAWIFPVFLRRFWGCSKITDKELEGKIKKLAVKAKVHVNGIYLWSLGGKSTPNAAMVGFLPPFQYLFISHGLVNRLSEEEVLGVVAHELGHLKKRHILFYLFMSISLLSAAEPVVFSLLQNRIYTIMALLGVFFLYIRFIFAWFSRRFEREADLFSAELLEDFRPLCRGLERIGIACGNIRNEASWHHYGICERVWFLEESYYNGRLRNSFKRNIRILRFTVITLLITVLALTVYGRFSIPVLLPEESRATAQREAVINRHKDWLKIDEILKDDSIFHKNEKDQ